MFWEVNCDDQDDRLMPAMSDCYEFQGCLRMSNFEHNNRLKKPAQVLNKSHRFKLYSRDSKFPSVISLLVFRCRPLW